MKIDVYSVCYQLRISEFWCVFPVVFFSFTGILTNSKNRCIFNELSFFFHLLRT